MTGIPRFQDPWWLLLLFVVPLVAWLRAKVPTGALTYSRLPLPTNQLRRGTWRLHLPLICRALAFVLLVLALARPQLGYTWEESLTEGIDIEIVLDTSGSMAAEDFQPKDRLTVAKQVVRDFVAGRTADRIGVVIFAGSALTRAPLTTDRSMLDLLVDSVELHTLPDGTAIGVALATATARLKDSTATSKVIVLVTDGVNNSGAIDPISATTIAEGLGIKVYTIGVGTDGQVPVPLPTRNPLTGREEIRRVSMRVEVDEELLHEIAYKTGGRFFQATDRESLSQIFAEIDQLERTEIKTRRYVRYREAFQPLAWSALALTLLPLLTTFFRVSVDP